MTQENQSQEKEIPSNQSSTEEKQEVVPLAKFLEQKNSNKELKEKLAAFEEKEKQIQEAKLLEEKNFQELLAQRDNEINGYKSQLEEERKTYKVNSVKDKFARVLDKNEAINSDDVMRLVDINSVVEAEDQDSLISKLVDDLKQNKAYLFKSKVIDHNENNKINNNNKQTNPAIKRDPVLSILSGNK